MLALVDSFGPGEPRLRRFVPRRAYRLVHAARMLAFHLMTVLRHDIPAKKTYVSERLARILHQYRNRAAARQSAPPPELMNQQGFGEALAAYQPELYPGRVVLFLGARLHWGLARTYDLGWAAVATDLEVVELPAYFGTTMLEPAVRLLAERVSDALDTSAPMTGVG